MQCKEYGKHNSDVIILLHGGGLSWWNYREEAELLENRFRVILPILDGHAGSDRDFSTIESNAADIISFIDEQFGGKVLLIGGLSLGGQILLEILSQRADICQYAMVESALVIPSKLTHSMIKPAFGSCYGLIRHRWFSRLQFKSLRIKPELFDDYYRDTCRITRQNMISFMQANSLYSLKDSIENNTAEIHVYAGDKETRAIRASAKRIHKKMHGSTLHILKRMYHGEFSINNAGSYVDEIYAVVKDR
ncbi:MAG: alpha/beta hydrolase [Ruminococcaceae bacterium]|nr:alpha/beta hydrolase [Oscillospiraceae bacterium]